MPLVTLLVALSVAIATGWLLVRFEHLHARLSLNDTASGPQKFHSKPTPRIGGVPIASGFIAGMGIALWQGAIDAAFFLGFCLAVLPAFGSGLLEDITKKLGPDMRLWASFLSALVAIYFFDAVVDRSGLPWVDRLLAWYPLALMFTMIGVGGVAHSVNIIDGYNGLAGVVTVMMLAALGIVSWQVGDTPLVTVCMALAGGTLGFLRWNFPRGQIFAGDGGAYLWGVSIALVAILLIHRNPSVSPWFPLLVVIYPVFETLFSVYRRKFKQASEAGLPDAKHLHQLIYRRLLSLRMHDLPSTPESRTLRNAATSPFLWALAFLAISPSVFFWQDTSALIGVTLTFCVIYVWLYRAIVTFSVPRSLRRLGHYAARLALRA